MAQMELAVLDFIQELFRNPFMDSLMPAVTSLGDAGFLWILLGLALLCSRKYRRTGAAVLLSLAADLVICRSGAMTLTELEAAGRASILIPSPNVAENHQYHNAMVLAEHGAAVVIEEKDLTGERLCQTIEELLSDPARLTELGKKAASLARLDANERISREILELAQEPAKA